MAKLWLKGEGTGNISKMKMTKGVKRRKNAWLYDNTTSFADVARKEVKVMGDYKPITKGTRIKVKGKPIRVK